MSKVPSLKCVCVLVGLVVAAVLVNTAFLGVVGDARKVGVIVQAWRDGGPHTTVMGKVRAYLCTAWWLGPFKPPCPTDPLVQCGVHGSLGWRATLSYVLNPKARLACLEEQVVQAQLEHNAFVLWFVVALCCLVAIVVCGAVLMVSWCLVLLDGDGDLWYPADGEVSQDSTTQPKKNRTLKRIQRLKLALQGDLSKVRGAKAPCIDTLVQKVRRDPLFRSLRRAMLKTPLLHSEQDTKVRKVSVKKLKQVFQRSEGGLGDSSSQAAAPTEPERQANSTSVQLSLHVPSRLQEWLGVSENGFLNHLTSRHSVQVLQDAPNDTLHIRGALDNVAECSREVLFMLDVWLKMEQ